MGVLTPEEYARKTLSADGAVQEKGMEAPMLKAGATVVMDPGFAWGSAIPFANAQISATIF